jgi:type VI secretion system Hcp family effector
MMDYQGEVIVHGKVQGHFGGKDKYKSGSECHAFSYQVEPPYDASTGQTSGKRQHDPVKITKEWGAATPQIFQALFSNEVLDSVSFEFVNPGSAGKQTVYQTIHLTNARIVQVHYAGGGKCSVSFVYEDISSVYGKPGSAAILHRGNLEWPVRLP